MEAELRQLQEQLQAQALEGGFAGWQAEPGDGWEQGGGSSRGSADGDAEEDGSWQVAGRSGASVQQVRGSHGNSSSSGGSSSQDSRSTLAVHHIDPAQDHRQLFHFFKRRGRSGWGRGGAQRLDGTPKRGWELHCWERPVEHPAKAPARAANNEACAVPCALRPAQVWVRGAGYQVPLRPARETLPCLPARWRRCQQASAPGVGSPSVGGALRTGRMVPSRPAIA